MYTQKWRTITHKERTIPTWFRVVLGGGALIATLTLLAVGGWTQTTFSSLVGTVHDPSNAVVANCKITVVNVATGEQRTAETDSNGDYQVLNLMPGTYNIRMEAPGFTPEEVTGLVLLTQQKVRIDRSLRVLTSAQQVEVTASAEAPIATEVSNIDATKLATEITDLPVMVASRASGSTSPFTTLTTQPGVEIDNSSKLSVGGLRPSQVMTSIDGLSTQSPFASAPSAELFPSFDGISEIHVDETDNSAEYDSVANIITVSKAGTNALHGSTYDNFMNTALNANNPFSTTPTPLHMNDFGASFGGPLVIPKVYNGKDKTFFFMDYEGLRKPSATLLDESVPSLPLREGNLSAYTTTIKNPYTGQPFTNNQIPQNLISPWSQAVLQYLYPLPNTGSPNSNVDNFVENFPTPIDVNQGDLRLDQNIGSKQSLFLRGTYKIVNQTNTPTGSALIGGVAYYYKYWAFSGGYNYIISPNVVNELRAGWSGEPLNYNFPLNGQTLANEIGLVPYLPQPVPDYNLTPNFAISGFQSAGGQYAQAQRSGDVQAVDNLSILRGDHTLKFGGSFQHMTAYRSNSFQKNLGSYTFNNSVTKSLVGNAFASFLLGIPDETLVTTSTDEPFDGWANVWAVYAQDSWRATPSVTLNFGLRWEYQPIMQDYGSNMGDFYPDIYAVANGQTVHGEFVVPNAAALSHVNPDVANSIAPTPIVLASQLGLPSDLRFNPTTDFAPRLGFAWRITGDNKNVLRGGYGIYYETLYGSVIEDLFAVESGYEGIFTNTITNGVPQLAFPSPPNPTAHPFPTQQAAPGSLEVCAAYNFHRADTSIHQWNLTYERDLGFQTGLRVSYDGYHTGDLGDTPNIDQVPPNTVGYTKATPPFPDFAEIFDGASNARGNYEAFTVDLHKRFSHGLEFEAAYNHAVNLADGAYAPTSFSGQSGSNPSNIYDLNYDYGNVPFTRRQRFQTTFVYNFPGYGSGALAKQLTNGWELAGVVLFQTGPFLSVQANGADPSGTNFENLIGNGRADVVPGVAQYPANKSVTQWVNPAAFAIPANDIGRYGDSQVGSVVGPGTQVVSLSLFKTFPLYKERAQFRLGASTANLFNHPNFLPPSLTLGESTFGTISNVQSADAGGPRQMLLSGRLTW